MQIILIFPAGGNDNQAAPFHLTIQKWPVAVNHMSGFILEHALCIKQPDLDKVKLLDNSYQRVNQQNFA
jgi:hypothetical protein